ncbi:MAG: elongation factor maturation arginine rhamnosyltransferase EarP [Rhodocyclales bacterium]|nr:elongation factor maturation arginine rhamnosyltransferase EarP [Rhodocyclales bacterium]
MPLRVDIFCAVIDNFGDAGVCWRLARQLVNEHGCSVRLWLDRPEVLEALVPAMQVLAGGENIDGVRLGDWQQAIMAEPADVVIEAFACNPPEACIARMARCARQPAWINLEYLSAENWVQSSHLLPSRHPQLGLTKYFYFPGFDAATGGLLKEARLDAARLQFQADAGAQSAFWQSCGVPAPQAEALCVSLFAYENAALPALLDAWATSAQPVYCAVPVGRSVAAIATWCGQALLQPGAVIDRGNLRIAVVPFLGQRDYDSLLWACDLNFVRGEDSFVRAQWAQRPFVWHIYQQDDNAHRIKLDAFLALFGAEIASPAQQALKDFWHAWERQDVGAQGVAACWPAFSAQLPALRRRAAVWAELVATHGDLCSRLLIFCQGLLE